MNICHFLTELQLSWTKFTFAQLVSTTLLTSIFFLLPEDVHVVLDSSIFDYIASR